MVVGALLAEDLARDWMDPAGQSREDLDNFARVNAIMEEFFEQPFPARAAVGVASLPKGADVEADAILAL